MQLPHTKQRPAPVRAAEPQSPCLQQVMAKMRRRDEAEFASALQVARIFWRRYRKLVQAPRFPRRFTKALQRDYYEPVSYRAGIAGEEIFSPDYEKRLRQEAEEFLKRRKLAKPRSGRSR